MNELERICIEFYTNLINRDYYIGSTKYIDDNGIIRQKELNVSVYPNIIVRMKDKANCNNKIDFMNIIKQILDKIATNNLYPKEYCLKIINKSIEENGIFNDLPKQYTRKELQKILMSIYPELEKNK